MAKITLHDHKIWVDATPIPLLGGEVHYWRLSPHNWRAILLRVKEMGIQVISTYVCWDFHEYAPGQFDFQGKTNPQRNLTGYLDLLTELGFWVIIRPGPYIYSEWSNAGVPDAAVHYHRLDPKFLDLARKYMEAVVPVLQPYFATQGGKIILFQADNEIDSWHQWYTEALGLGSQPGLFHEFLRERYAGLNELNGAWGTNFIDYEQARAVMSLPPGRNELLVRYLDFCRFKHWFVLKAAQWNIDTYRELGVDLPFYLNTYGDVKTQPWSEMEKIADLVGPDLYPTNEFTKRPEEHRHFLESIRYARSYSRLPYICEFEAGIWHGWHYEVGAPSGNHYRLMCLSALAGGITGWSWYMLVNRDNWYGCPINEWGRLRPELYLVFKQMIELFHQMDPTTTERLVACAVTFDLLQQASQQTAQDLLKAFYQADIDYDFFDPTGTPETWYPGIKGNPALLFYAGGNWSSRITQENLRKYVLDGGHLIFLGHYPCLDDQLRPFSLFGIVEPDGIIGDVGDGLKLEIELNDIKTVVHSAWLGYYAEQEVLKEVSCKPIHVKRKPSELATAEEVELLFSLVEGDEYTIGYTISLGAGRLTVLHLTPSPELLRSILAWSDAAIPSLSDSPGIQTALYRRGRTYFLVVVNTTNQANTARVTIDNHILGEGVYQTHDLVTDETRDINISITQPLVVSVPRKDGTIVQITPIATEE